MSLSRVFRSPASSPRMWALAFSTALVAVGLTSVSVSSADAHAPARHGDYIAGYQAPIYAGPSTRHRWVSAGLRGDGFRVDCIVTGPVVRIGGPFSGRSSTGWVKNRNSRTGALGWTNAVYMRFTVTPIPCHVKYRRR